MSEYIISDNAIPSIYFDDGTINKRIIRCRDCKHYGGPPFYGANMAYCMMHQSMLKDSNGFCAWAKPKEEA